MKHIPVLLVFALALLAGIVFSGCKDSATSAGAPGNITGSVIVLDTLYHQMRDQSGVSVSLEGTSFKTISDASGKWYLGNVSPGTYTLTFSKDNYSSYKNQNFQFSGNGTLYYNLGSYISMYPLPNLFPNIVLRPFEDYVKITYLKDTLIFLDSVHYHDIELFDTTITKMDLAIFSSHSQYQYNEQNVYGIIYFGKTLNIDPGNPSAFLYSLTSDSYADTSGVTNFSVHRSDLLKSGFSSGDKIYCSTYGYVYTGSSWIDPATNKIIHTDLSPHHSDVVSFILP